MPTFLAHERISSRLRLAEVAARKAEGDLDTVEGLRAGRGRTGGRYEAYVNAIELVSSV